MIFDEESRPFRWFLLPSEAQQCLKGQSSQKSSHRGQSSEGTSPSSKMPFCPWKLCHRFGVQPKSILSADGNEKKLPGEDLSVLDSVSSNSHSVKNEVSFMKGMVQTLQSGFHNIAPDDLEVSGSLIENQECANVDENPDADCILFEDRSSNYAKTEPLKMSTMTKDTESDLIQNQRHSFCQGSSPMSESEKKLSNELEIIPEMNSFTGSSTVNKQNDFQGGGATDSDKSNTTSLSRLKRISVSNKTTTEITDQEKPKAKKTKILKWHCPGKKIFNPFLEVWVKP